MAFCVAISLQCFVVVLCLFNSANGKAGMYDDDEDDDDTMPDVGLVMIVQYVASSGGSPRKVPHR